MRTTRWRQASPLPYLVLLRTGFTLPLPLPEARCALTAPFHPYPEAETSGRYLFCGTFRGLAPPRRYLASCPLEPGLSSILRKAGQRLPDQLRLPVYSMSPRIDQPYLTLRNYIQSAQSPEFAWMDALRVGLFYGLIKTFLPDVGRFHVRL